MGIDELRDEFDWMFEFQSRMAERIRGDADVHNLADYVAKIEAENAKLRELVRDMWEYIYIGTAQDGQSLHDRTRELGIEVD
jgi:hypothetical protein